MQEQQVLLTTDLSPASSQLILIHMLLLLIVQPAPFSGFVTYFWDGSLITFLLFLSFLQTCP